MTDAEVLLELRSLSSLNKARAKFRYWSARIEQAQSQRRPIGPIETRRMEFEAVKDILETYGDGLPIKSS